MDCSVRLKWLDCVIIISAIMSAMLYPQRRSLRILLMNQKSTLNITSQANASFLIFNRNPKAASQTICRLLDKLHFPNNFTSVHEVTKLAKGEKKYLGREEQKFYIEMFMDKSKKLSYSYCKHINFLNFEEFGLQNPIYINFVREPVEKAISWYYYKRQNYLKMPFEDCVHQRLPECIFDIGSSVHYGPNGGNHISQISFFCGMNKVCDEFGSPEALELAKWNVERYYSVVGVVEKMTESLQVLENYVPAYFRYARKIYKEIMKEELANLNKGKPKVSKGVKQLMQQNFTLEIEFYEFCKRRLMKQFLALN